MQKRRLGRTDMMISCIGLGGMGFVSKNNKRDKPSTIINTALNEGVNFIDTARSYYDSERIIGEAIHGRRKDCFIATKTYLRGANEVKREVEISLKNLRIEQVDLYQIHHVQYKHELERVLAKDGALAGLREAQKKGKIRFIGASSHHPAVALECIKTGEFDAIQIPFSPIEREFIDEILREAKKRDVGVIAMKPLAGGRILNAELALKFILSYGISIAIPGCSTVEEVKLDTRIGKCCFSFTEKEKKLLFEEVEKLGGNFCRRCRYCENVCTIKLPIADIFRCEDHILYNVTYARNEYKKFQKEFEKCTDCGKCEQICPYKLPIRAMLKNAHCRLTKGRTEDAIVNILRRLGLYERVRNIYFDMGFPIPKRWENNPEFSNKEDV